MTTDDHKEIAQQYYGLRFRYLLNEQIVSAFPIVMAVAFTFVAMTRTGWDDLATVGAAVAVLPRTLQLLGNAHAVALIISRFYMYRTKFYRLRQFWGSLQIVEPKVSIDHSALRVRNLDGDSFTPSEDIFELLQRNALPRGRYLVTGQNGSGKSTLLRYLKSTQPNGILVSPDVNFAILNESNLSTGQERAKNLETALASDAKILFLDEWDGNLDAARITEFDRLINEAAITRRTSSGAKQWAKSQPPRKLHQCLNNPRALQCRLSIDTLQAACAACLSVGSVSSVQVIADRMERRCQALNVSVRLRRGIEVTAVCNSRA